MVAALCLSPVITAALGLLKVQEDDGFLGGQWINHKTHRINPDGRYQLLTTLNVPLKIPLAHQ